MMNGMVLSSTVHYIFEDLWYIVVFYVMPFHDLYCYVMLRDEGNTIQYSMVYNTIRI